MESLLVPYQAVAEIPCTHALVLAPHPDDEVFGCGGAIMRHVGHGVPVRVIIVSDGAHGVSDENLASHILQRQGESMEAAKVLGYGVPIFWHYRDREICYGEKMVRDILAAIDDAGADLVYAPSVFEMHPDHRALGMAAVEAVRRLGKKVRLALYEVGMPLCPNLLLDISDLAERKMAAMKCFVSQNEKQRYDLDIAALNRYRTYTLPASVTAAEAYILVAAEELANDPLKLYQSEHDRQRELGLRLDGRDAPLVSVIIRSMDRPTLSDVLDSVALQTYPNIEVVVVNAKGAGHRKMGEWCGRFPLRLVGTGERLQRSRAANRGLDDACGEYLIFLDDDDSFEAEHVEKLARAIESHPDVKVVYSGVRCVDEDKNPLPTKFATPFDSTQLLAGNYIPVNAALFSKKLLELGCRVDESLDLYEDWDFWIQLSRFTDFQFVDGISAVYRINRQSGSGVHLDSSRREIATLAIYRKWHGELSDDQLVKIMQLVRQMPIKDNQIFSLHQAVGERDGQIVALSNKVAERDGQIVALSNKVAERDEQIVALRNSSSWRITAPLRWFGHQYKRAALLAMLAPRALKLGGGLLATLNKALAIYRREGVAGLKRGLIRVCTHGVINPTPGSDGFDRNDYTEWARRYDALSSEQCATMRQQLDQFAAHPLISVIMPVYNPNPAWLQEAIESVQRQIYPHWELCIADDASTDPHIKPLLQKWAAADSRIKVVFRAENGHICAASNSALELATGDWFALLDHDDLLPDHALFWVVHAINQHPNAQLIYSDEDKINEQGKRLGPYFKCDWNIDLFYSHNMFSHLGVYAAQLVRAVGGFRLGYEGSQDYDLALRCVEQVGAQGIHHIPRVLYHWRIHAQSTAHDNQAKPYAKLAGERALNDHFERTHTAGRAELTGFGYRVHYALPSPVPLVSIIIPTRNGLQLLRQCIESVVHKTTYPNYEILVVDNGSDDPDTLSYLVKLAQQLNVRVLRDERSFNYSALNNMAVQTAKGQVLALLHNDTEVISPDWLTHTVALAMQPGVGAVGAKLSYPNDHVQHAGMVLGIGGLANHSHKHLPRQSPGYFSRAALMQSFSAVTGACLVVAASKYQQVGGLNEAHLAVAFNDVDFCLKLKQAGYRNVWTPYAELHHHESVTRGDEDNPEKVARFNAEVAYVKATWGRLLHNDPAYSPNLTLDFEDFSYAWPPRVEKL